MSHIQSHCNHKWLHRVKIEKQLALLPSGNKFNTEFSPYNFLSNTRKVRHRFHSKQMQNPTVKHFVPFLASTLRFLSPSTFQRMVWLTIVFKPLQRVVGRFYTQAFFQQEQFFSVLIQKAKSTASSKKTIYFAKVLRFFTMYFAKAFHENRTLPVPIFIKPLCWMNMVSQFRLPCTMGWSQPCR